MLNTALCIHNEDVVSTLRGKIDRLRFYNTYYVRFLNVTTCTMHTIRTQPARNPMSDDAQSQNLKAILGLRGMIVDGLIAPGARVSELLLVEKLGISRTPARIALVQLRNEGLLEALPTGGFVVASFSELDILEAIEIRGTLEGMAARYAAEPGA